MTPLKGVDNQIYALAQGNLLVSGAGAQSGGSRVQVNQLNGARISDGATVEREVPIDFATRNTITLQLHQDDFTAAQSISDAINSHFSGGAATAEDARTIKLYAPTDSASRVRFLSRILDLPVRVQVMDAKVIVNARTGSVVMNRHVMLDSCAVAGAPRRLRSQEAAGLVSRIHRWRAVRRSSRRIRRSRCRIVADRYKSVHQRRSQSGRAGA